MKHTRPDLSLRPTGLSSAHQAFAFILVLIVTIGVADVVRSQSHLRGKRVRASICGNPKLPCKTVATFQPYDLPFRVPENSVIFDTELFYGIVLKSVRANEDDCKTFVPEVVRLEAQALFPDRKVFASRCIDVESLFYTNVDPKFRIMAVYGGTTLAEAKGVLSAVKKIGKFPDAYVRQMRTGFNGT
ncbi:MAG TPA: hypothetical protein VGN90_05455 [Pyrinomonadaceae bacterium]|jgi:hypothetical protein|nr:hypothetical protein [Pyrinomonadaceae bacterium]